ncbi:hypothetical protein [Bradyrhizobium niftali]|uniref:hypothetical protein n=1 Tax=Bradyrhizobium niftali TaxID=2560055 RepID=UPI001F3D224C|nr:hypothetical protein [Bradyrhizobium niftali]
MDQIDQALLPLRLLLQDLECLSTATAIRGDGALAKMNGRHRLTMKFRNTPEAVTSAPAAPSTLPQV